MLAIRQCAARASTLTAQNIPETKKSLETKETYAQGLFYLLYLLLLFSRLYL